MGFEDFATATKFRDLVTRIAEDTVERMRPRYRYATVMSIDRNNYKATVQFPGETSTVTVGMGALQPATTGQRVRIHGVQGERYIADVIGMPALHASHRAAILGQYTLSGGGQVIWSGGTHLKWSQRFIAIAVGQGAHYTTNGHYNIYQPASGVIIPGIGTPNVTVTTAGVPIPAWSALYAIPTYGENSNSITNKTTTVQGVTTAHGFAIVQYNTDFVVPDHWIFVAGLNSDDGRIKLGTGQIIDYWRNPVFENGWTNYGDIWETAGYYKDGNNMVHLKGLIKNGTLDTHAFTLPAGYRPAAGVHAMSISNNAGAGFRIYSNGQVIVGSPGQSVWLSLRIPPFLAEN
jgi:hypothetical protein